MVLLLRCLPFVLPHFFAFLVDSDVEKTNTLLLLLLFSGRAASSDSFSSSHLVEYFCADFQVALTQCCLLLLCVYSCADDLAAQRPAHPPHCRAGGRPGAAAREAGPAADAGQPAPDHHRGARAHPGGDQGGARAAGTGAGAAAREPGGAAGV